MKWLFPAISSFALVGCTSPIANDINRPPESISVNGRSYTLITKPQLLGTLKGRQMVDDPCRDTSGCTDRFSYDGRSLERTGDAVALVQGEYTVPGNRFCATIVKGWTYCKALFRAANGTYATMKFDGEWRDAVQVRITPLASKA